MIKKTDKIITGRYQIKCPICRKRLMDYSEGIEAYASPTTEMSHADFFAKCKYCRNEIGIRKLN